MKIGIISDTHNAIEATSKIVSKLIESGAEYLIHAGDIGEDVARYLAGLEIPLIAVYGNTDTSILQEILPQIHKEPCYFQIEDKSFKLMHHPYFLTPDCDVIIYGHLHRFECDFKRSLYINPGEVCAREKPRNEAALLDTEKMSVVYIWLENGQWHNKVFKESK